MAKLIMERDGLDQDEAIKRVMLSETFEKLTSDMSLWDAEPEFLLAMYDEEAARCTITTAPKKM